jgi:hypothetical protein
MEECGSCRKRHARQSRRWLAWCCWCEATCMVAGMVKYLCFQKMGILANIVLQIYLSYLCVVIKGHASKQHMILLTSK